MPIRRDGSGILRGSPPPAGGRNSIGPPDAPSDDSTESTKELIERPLAAGVTGASMDWGSTRVFAHTGVVPIVDPEPWFRRERDERLAELRRQLDAGADAKRVRTEMRRAKWEYRRAFLKRFLGRPW